MANAASRWSLTSGSKPGSGSLRHVRCDGPQVLAGLAPLVEGARRSLGLDELARMSTLTTRSTSGARMSVPNPPRRRLPASTLASASLTRRSSTSTSTADP